MTNKYYVTWKIVNTGEIKRTAVDIVTNYLENETAQSIVDAIIFRICVLYAKELDGHRIGIIQINRL